MSREFYELGLRSNLWYTFNSVDPDHLGDQSLGVRKIAYEQNRRPPYYNN